MRTASVLLSDKQHAGAVELFVNDDIDGTGMVQIKFIPRPAGKRNGRLTGKKLKDAYHKSLEVFNLSDYEMQQCVDLLASKDDLEWGNYLYMVDNQFEGIISFADWQ